MGCHLPRKLLPRKHNVIIAKSRLASRRNSQQQTNSLFLSQRCYEERVFFRLLSGFQSSITAHIFNNFHECAARRSLVPAAL
jgi:hypothetical protein